MELGWGIFIDEFIFGEFDGGKKFIFVEPGGGLVFGSKNVFIVDSRGRRVNGSEGGIILTTCPCPCSARARCIGGAAVLSGGDLDLCLLGSSGLVS